MGKDFIEVKGSKLGIDKKGMVRVEIGSVIKLPVGFLRGNPRQPRKYFDEEGLKTMAKSYRRRGDVEYSVMVDGERRWRAAKMAGIEKISCQICSPMDDKEILLVSTKANLCREDMSPIEEAISIKRLMDDYGWNQREVADEIGKTSFEISNLLKYLKLGSKIQEMVVQRKIGKGIAKLLSSFDLRGQKIMLQSIIEKTKDGRSIHPNEASRILRKEAADRGLVIKRARGKKHISHTDLTISHVMTTTQRFVGALEELALIVNDGSLAKSAKGKIHPLELIKELERAEKINSRVLEILDVVIA